MNGLVLDLQQELLKSDADILSALRKAHLIAAKLKLSDFDKWIQAELNGYPKSEGDVPDYRQVKGDLRAKNPRVGWIPFVFNSNDVERKLCTMPVYESISELLELSRRSKDGYFTYSFPAEQTLTLAKMTNMPIYMQIALFVSIHRIQEIVEQVKNGLLEWTLKLEEEGILGEGMRFTEKEADSAKTVPQQIHYYFGSVINGNVNGSQVVSGDSNSMNYTATDVSAAIHEIRESLKRESIETSDRESALELLDEINTKIEQNKKPGVIKSALIGLKDFSMDVGAEITAGLIMAKIQGMF